MDIVERCIARAREREATVVFAEPEDPRVLWAARRLTEQRIARPVLVGADEAVQAAAANAGVDLSGVLCVDPDDQARIERYAGLYAAGPRALNPRVAQRLVRKPLFFAGMMLRAGEADALVAGVSHPSARVLEAGLMTVGLAEGMRTPSSFFLIVVPDYQGRGERAFVFADCAVNADPSSDDLADIALASADSARRLLGEEPRVAMLSFSTHGSAQHTRIDTVREALAIACQRAPDLAIDGELQVDAALMLDVARTKIAGDSPVAGCANVLIFPDLTAGNIGYKLVQYMAGARAIGPILQGFARPVSDLSRGARVDDIVAAAAIALAQG